MAKKILIYVDIDTKQVEAIRQIADRYGCQVVQTLDPDRIKEEAADAEVIFGVAPGPLAGAKELKWFCTRTAGVNIYMEPGILPENCLLSNSAGAYGVTIAEHIIMTTLMLMRQFKAYDQILDQAAWPHDLPMVSLHGSRITVLGTGDIGTTFADRVKSFGPARIVGVNRKGSKPSDDYDEICTIGDLSKVLPETDLLVMSLPETPETIDVLNEETLALLPPTAYVVNVGRGSAVDEDAIAKALNEGKLAGAALDVMKTEPLPLDSPLRSARNILLTPHSAGQMTLGYTQQKSVDMFCEDLENYLSGKPMKYLVDRKLGY